MRVRRIDREKLAFFSPCGLKYTFKVVLFGPNNAPVFYMVMMKNMKDEWDCLFLLIMIELTVIDKDIVDVTATMDGWICSNKLISGTKLVVDYILLWCSNIDSLFIYFECICKVFKTIG